ncbi:hypothetical protein ACET3Z_010785 [Daucus carota]
MEFSPPIHIVSSTESPQFNNLNSLLTRSSLVGLDAEWKPVRHHQSTFPTVTLLQIACRVDSESLVFLLDLLAIPLVSIHELLKQVFESPRILKLGFQFKQDLLYLSSTFVSQGCDPGFDKEQQCSDWLCRPLTEEQIRYAAADAHCLLKIFDVLQCKFREEGNSLYAVAEINAFHELNLGLKQPDSCNVIINTKFCNALEMGKRHTSNGLKNKQIGLENIDDWEGPPPWDLSLGGDGCPKFLCDRMIEGLAKQLRCVGIDAAVPYSKKPDNRTLVEQADKEKRVLLTRDAKLLRHDYLIKNQIYRLKNHLKKDQLIEVHKFHAK